MKIHCISSPVVLFENRLLFLKGPLNPRKLWKKNGVLVSFCHFQAICIEALFLQEDKTLTRKRIYLQRNSLIHYLGPPITDKDSDDIIIKTLNQKLSEPQ